MITSRDEWRRTSGYVGRLTQISYGWQRAPRAMVEARGDALRLLNDRIHHALHEYADALVPGSEGAIAQIDPCPPGCLVCKLWGGQ